MWTVKRTASSIYVRDESGKYWESDYTPVIDFNGVVDPVHPEIFDYVFSPYEPPDTVFMGMPFGDRSRLPHSTVRAFPQIIRTASAIFAVPNTFPANSPIRLYDVDQAGTRNCGRVWDIGNMRDRTHGALSTILSKITPKGIPIVTVGGDHACTYDVASRLTDLIAKPITLWHFDAHFDRYTLPGSGQDLDHGNFITHLENTGMFRIIHIGGRGLRGCEQMIASSFDSLSSSQFSLERFRQFVDAIPPTASYLSVDMDCLDPRDFPWVDFPIPNGIPGSIMEKAIEYLFQSHHSVIAADIVEANADGNPERADYVWAVRILVAILEGLVTQQRKVLDNPEMRQLG